jgi:hypothetical protein
MMSDYTLEITMRMNRGETKYGATQTMFGVDQSNALDEVPKLLTKMMSELETFADEREKDAANTIYFSKE